MTTNILESGYTIRFSDCDPFQHLNNSKYVDYFLNAREDHLKSAYQMDLATLAAGGQAWVVKNHMISYLRPAFYNEQVIIQSLLLNVTQDGLLLEMVMLDKSKKQFKAIMHTEFVAINPTTGKKRLHDPEFLTFLEEKVLAPEVAFSHSSRIEFWLQQLKSEREKP